MTLVGCGGISVGTEACLVFLWNVFVTEEFRYPLPFLPLASGLAFSQAIMPCLPGIGLPTSASPCCLQTALWYSWTNLWIGVALFTTLCCRRSSEVGSTCIFSHKCYEFGFSGGLISELGLLGGAVVATEQGSKGWVGRKWHVPCQSGHICSDLSCTVFSGSYFQVSNCSQDCSLNVRNNHGVCFWIWPCLNYGRRLLIY